MSEELSYSLDDIEYRFLFLHSIQEIVVNALKNSENNLTPNSPVKHLMYRDKLRNFLELIKCLKDNDFTKIKDIKVLLSKEKYLFPGEFYEP